MILFVLKSFHYLCVCFWLKSVWFVAVHGVWEEWSPWSLCSFTCGRGQRTRTRSCIPPQYGGRSCDGPETQHKPCNIALCPGELIQQLCFVTVHLMWVVCDFLYFPLHIGKKPLSKVISLSNIVHNSDCSG